MKINENSQKTLRESIYEELKNQILRGLIEPGTRLMEIELSKKMGASRTPIREAIKMLADDDLVTIEPNKGATVSRVAVRDLLEILEIRECLDGETAYHAANRITDEVLEELRQAMENYNQAAENKDKIQMVIWDTNFHKVMVDATENKVMVKIAHEMRELVLRFRYLYYGDFKRSMHVSIEHKAIFDAIERGDADEARRLAQVHVRNIKENIIKAYGKIVG